MVLGRDGKIPHFVRDDNFTCRLNRFTYHPERSEGPFAFAREDLLSLVPLITRDTKLRVLPHPADEAARPPSEEEEVMSDFEDFDEKEWS